MEYTQFVDYSKIDPLKILAQKAAKETVKNFSLTTFKEVGISRGESAYVIDCGDFYLASIVEGLGTKSLVADTMYQITGKTYYEQIAQDTIAMAVNDIISVGAKPLVIHAYWAAGSSAWFNDQKRMKDLIKGWKKACDLAGAIWGGGETPVLADIISSKTIELACSCVGIIKPKSKLTLGEQLKAGDIIVLLESSGIHANGLTLARKLAEKLPHSYQTKINNNWFYGEALLVPTIIYAKVIQSLLDAGVNLHYMVNITGHGWRKIMRHPKKFTYLIEKLPPVPSVLKFIVERGSLNVVEAYASLNMGAGFALYLSEKDLNKTLTLTKKHKIKAYVAGRVKKGQKQVIIKPLKIIYPEESLRLR